MPCSFIPTTPRVSKLGSAVRVQAGGVDIALTPHAALALQQQLRNIAPLMVEAAQMRTDLRESLIDGPQVVNLCDRF